jgi:hypothetical protein
LKNDAKTVLEGEKGEKKREGEDKTPGALKYLLGMDQGPDWQCA